MAGRRGGRVVGIELDGLEVRLEALLQFDARLLRALSAAAITNHVSHGCAREVQPAVAVWLALTYARTWLPGAHHAMLRCDKVFRAPTLRARGGEGQGAYVEEERQLLRIRSSPGESMKQRAIRERRNHKPQDARRFNCRLNCGPTRTYATNMEATLLDVPCAADFFACACLRARPSLQRCRLPASCLVRVPRSALSLFAVPRNCTTLSRATPSHMAVQKHRDCRSLPLLSTWPTLGLVPQLVFVFASDRLSLTHARLQKRKACALVWLETHPRKASGADSSPLTPIFDLSSHQNCGSITIL